MPQGAAGIPGELDKHAWQHAGCHLPAAGESAVSEASLHLGLFMLPTLGPLELLTLIDLFPLAFPTDSGAPGPAVPADGPGGAWRNHRWGGRDSGLSLSQWAEGHAENSVATGRGCP